VAEKEKQEQQLDSQEVRARWYHGLWPLLVLVVLAVFIVKNFKVKTPSDKIVIDGKERILIDYWEKWTGFEGDAMQAVVDAFNKKQDKIFVKKLTVSQIDRKMMLATAGGNPPDLAGLWSHFVPVYAEKGALTPLDSRLQEAGITRDDYIPIFWDLCGHRGFMWALPTTPASIALHWNKKMFRDAGLDPDRPPQSLDELDKMGEQITLVEVERNGERVRMRYPELTDEERKDYKFNIIKLGYVPSEPGWWNGLWGYWFGATLLEGRTITANSPENVECFEWYGSYTKKYGLDNLRQFGASFGNFSSPQNPFLAGQVAMVIQGVWMYNFIDKYAPHLEWAAAPFPSKYPDKYPLTTVAECDVLVIPKGSRHVDEAFEFIKYVNSQEGMEMLNLGQRKFSALAEHSPGFIKEHPNPFIEVFIELAKSPNVAAVPRISIWNEYNEEMGIAADQIYNLLATPQEALDSVRERVQWKYDKVMRRWDLVKEERIKQWSEE
jgi:ABC-type glycerol-3-phosphate transport system substrate-binding protein